MYYSELPLEVINEFKSQDGIEHFVDYELYLVPKKSIYSYLQCSNTLLPERLNSIPCPNCGEPQEFWLSSWCEGWQRHRNIYHITIDSANSHINENGRSCLQKNTRFFAYNPNKFQYSYGTEAFLLMYPCHKARKPLEDIQNILSNKHKAIYLSAIKLFNDRKWIASTMLIANLLKELILDDDQIHLTGPKTQLIIDLVEGKYSNEKSNITFSSVELVLELMHHGLLSVAVIIVITTLAFLTTLVADIYTLVIMLICSSW